MSYDALSDVLRAVSLKGVVFFDVEASSPWVAEAPPAKVVGPGIMPGVDHVIEYHIVTSGSCWATLLEGDGRSVRLSAGDVVAFPQGDPHVLASEPHLRAVPDLSIHRPPEAPDALPLQFNLDGGGERARVICGFLGCDARPFNPLLGALPRMLYMPNSEDKEWRSRFLDFARLENAEKRAGGASMLAKVGEIMFIDLIRHHLASQSENTANWLAGLRDRHVGRALGLLHEAPHEHWDLNRLARESGISRSSLAERFTHFVGMAPIRYLAQWRMQLAAEKLATGDASIARIAAEIGYESEAAFSRAFKRIVGVSPAAWRGSFARRSA
jgi:AraC-like DNA-binding protein